LPIKDTQDWVARARALAPMIEAAAGRTEKERKIPADVLSAMHACGLFHMLLPVSLGGSAVDLVTFNQWKGADKPRRGPTFLAAPLTPKAPSNRHLCGVSAYVIRQGPTEADSSVFTDILTPLTPRAITS
jgi:hypothetical protein